MAGMTEDQVVEGIAQWLCGQGYKVTERVVSDPTATDVPLEVAPGRSRAGVDLVADAPGLRWILEAKGDPPRPQWSVDIPTLFGQIVRAMKRNGGDLRFAVAVPWSRVEGKQKPNVSSELRRYADSIVWKALNLWFIAVRDDGSVTCKSPEEVGPFLAEALH